MSATSLLVTCGIMTQLRCRLAPEIFLMRDKGLDSIWPNLAKSTLGQPSTLKPPSPPDALIVAAPPPAASAPLTNLRTSSWVMRFLAPEPVTVARFTPSSRANLRTDGDACGRFRKGTLASANDSVGE